MSDKEETTTIPIEYYWGFLITLVMFMNGIVSANDTVITPIHYWLPFSVVAHNCAITWLNKKRGLGLQTFFVPLWPSSVAAALVIGLLPVFFVVKIFVAAVLAMGSVFCYSNCNNKSFWSSVRQAVNDFCDGMCE